MVELKWFSNVGMCQNRLEGVCSCRVADLAGSSLGVPVWPPGGPRPVTDTRVLFLFPFLVFEASAMVPLALRSAPCWEIHPALWDFAFCMPRGGVCGQLAAARPCKAQSPDCPFFSSLSLIAAPLFTDVLHECTEQALVRLPFAGGSLHWNVQPAPGGSTTET